MKRIFVLTVAALTLAFGLSSNIFAQSPADGNAAQTEKGKAHPREAKFGGDKFRKGNVLKELNLSEKQKSDINAINIDNKKKIIDLKSDLAKNRLDKEEMIKSGKFDKDKYLGFIEKENKITSDIRTNNAQTKIKIFDLLDSKQQEIWLKHAGKFLEFGDRAGDLPHKKFPGRFPGK